jgi:uncharacterized protein (DUF2147 family)
MLIALLVLCAVKAHAAAPSPLIGTWSEVGGPGMARIATCPGASSALCATGLSRNKAGQIVETGLVLTNVQPDGTNRWRGSYLDGSRKLPATIRLINPQKVTMKVCVLVICQTATYQRVK